MDIKNWNKIDLFVGFEKGPLEEYNLFNIKFNMCNYIFIIPETFSLLFSSFYTKILKDELIFFPKDFNEAKDLLNAYENEVGIKENWIIISSCIELEKNINDLHENKDIYQFIGYCPIFNHFNNMHYFYKFPKFYGIVDSCEELLEKLFKLNNIFYYRKKLNFNINNINNKDIMEAKFETKILIDLNNDYSKNHVIKEKLINYFQFKKNNDDCYFAFIKSLILINECLEIKNYNFLFNQVKQLSDKIILSDNEYENKLFSIIFFKNLHLLYLYFSNYPYVFGKLSDEEILQIISNFKSNMDKTELESNIVSGFNSLIPIIDSLANKIDKGISILNENEKLKNMQRIIIETCFSMEQLNKGINIEELCKYYQIKNYIRDIDFCLGKFFITILTTYCKGYFIETELTSSFLNKEQRFRYYLE